MAKQFHTAGAIIARCGEALFRFAFHGASAAVHVLISVSGGKICHSA
jgi:bacteriorhodopsin